MSSGGRLRGREFRHFVADEVDGWTLLGPVDAEFPEIARAPGTYQAHPWPAKWVGEHAKGD